MCKRGGCIQACLRCEICERGAIAKSQSVKEERMGYLLGFVLAILVAVGEPARAGFVDLIQIKDLFRIPSIFSNLRSGTWGRLSGRPTEPPLADSAKPLV
jgi:hypothetical protein